MANYWPKKEWSTKSCHAMIICYNDEHITQNEMDPTQWSHTVQFHWHVTSRMGKSIGTKVHE